MPISRAAVTDVFTISKRGHSKAVNELQRLVDDLKRATDPNTWVDDVDLAIELVNATTDLIALMSGAAVFYLLKDKLDYEQE